MKKTVRTAMDNLTQQLELIGRTISEPFSADDPEGLIEALNNCASLLSSSSWTVAESEKLLKQAEGKYIHDMLHLENQSGSLPASIMKKDIESATAEEQYSVRLAERYNSGLDKKIRALITTISFLKEELNKSSYQPT